MSQDDIEAQELLTALLTPLERRERERWPDRNITREAALLADFFLAGPDDE